MRTITAWRYSGVVVIGNDETRRVSAAREWDSLCCSDGEGRTPHRLPLTEQVCVRVASWELQPIHHVCLCSRALWHTCLPSTCVSAVAPIGVLLCQGLGRLHPTPPTLPLRFCQWRTSSHGNLYFQVGCSVYWGNERLLSGLDTVSCKGGNKQRNA